MLTVWRANLLGSSGKGNEYFLHHLLGADAAVRAEETRPDSAPPRSSGTTRRRAASSTCSSSLDFRMTSTACSPMCVLPAATWYEKYDLSSTDMHPFVHAFNAAIAPPWETRSDYDAFVAIAKEFSRLAATHLGHAPRPCRHAAAARHARTRLPSPGRGARLAARRVRPGPGSDDAALLPWSSATTPRSARRWPRSGQRRTARHRRERRHLEARSRGRVPAPQERRRARRARRRPPGLARAEHACEAILALSGTTNGRLAVQGFGELERADRHAAGRPGRATTRASGSPSPTPRSRPEPVITSPGVVRQRDTAGAATRRSRSTSSGSKPWHTLTGRQHFFLDHDWMAELGEQLPVFRPPLDMKRLFGDPGMGEDGRLGADGALPDAALEVVDPLRVPGQPVHADAVPRRPGRSG